jgi:hypothetical protein
LKPFVCDFRYLTAVLETHDFWNGGENRKVCEHLPVVIFDVSVFPEPKALRKEDLEKLLPIYGSISGLARAIGVSFSTAQEKLRPARRWDPKKKKFTPLSHRRRSD